MSFFNRCLLRFPSTNIKLFFQSLVDESNENSTASSISSPVSNHHQTTPVHHAIRSPSSQSMQHHHSYASTPPASVQTPLQPQIGTVNVRANSATKSDSSRTSSTPAAARMAPLKVSIPNSSDVDFASPVPSPTGTIR